MADSEIMETGVLTGTNDPVETEAEEAIVDENLKSDLDDLRATGEYETEQTSSNRHALKGEDGKFVSADTNTPLQGSAQTESAEPSQEDSAVPEGYSEAVRVMLREGFTEGALRSMDKDELINSANGRIDQQKAGDGVGNRIKALEDQLSQRDKGTSTDSTAEPSLLEKLEPRLKQMTEEGEGNIAEILRELAQRPPQQTVSDPVSERLQRDLEALQDAQRTQGLQSARKNLSEKWNLRDEIRYARVEEEMRGLDQVRLPDGTAKYKSMDSLMNAAASVVYGDDRIKELESNLGVQHDKRNAGQTSTIKQTSGDKKLVSKDPIRDVLQELRKPKSEQDAGYIEKLTGQHQRLPALQEMDEVLGVDDRMAR